MILPLLGASIGGGTGLSRHLSEYRTQYGKWQRGRARPPIKPRSTKIWDLLAKPKRFTPLAVRKTLGGAATGALTGVSLENLRVWLARRKKKRK